MLTIRKAQRSDLKTVLSLWQQLVDHHRSFAPGNTELAPHLRTRPNAAKGGATWIRKQIGSRNGVVFLAEIDARPVGYCLITIFRIPRVSKIKRMGYISELLVKKEFRGQRVSSKLKDEALQWFRRKGIKYVSLTVLEKNSAPQSIYKTWGFFPFVVEMRKNL